MPTANAEGWIEWEGGIGKVSARRVSGHLQTRRGSSAFAVGMLRDIVTFVDADHPLDDFRSCKGKSVAKYSADAAPAVPLLAHHRARTCTYKYHGKIDTAGNMAAAHEHKVDKAAAAGHTFVDAEVRIISGAGAVDAKGVAKLELKVTHATTRVMVSPNKYETKKFPGLTRKFYFSQGVFDGKVHHVEHPEDEEGYVIQIKKTIASLVHVESLKRPAPTETTTLYEAAEKLMGQGSSLHPDSPKTHTANYHVDQTATHLQIKKRLSGSTLHAPRRIGNTHGALRMLHTTNDVMLIELATGTVTEAEKEVDSTTEKIDAKKEGSAEADSTNNRGRATPGSANRGESFGSKAMNTLTLVGCDAAPAVSDDRASRRLLEAADDTTRFKRVPLADDSHAPTVAETLRAKWLLQDRLNENRVTTDEHVREMKRLMAKRLAEKAQDHDHLHFNQLVDMATEHPRLISELKDMCAKNTSSEDEFGMAVDILSTVGTTQAQKALLSLMQNQDLPDKHRHVALSSFTLMGRPYIVMALHSHGPI